MVAIGNIGAIVPLTPAALAVRALERALPAELGVPVQAAGAQQDVVQISLQARTQAQNIQPNLAVGLNFANAANPQTTQNALVLNLAIPALPVDTGAPLASAEPRIQLPTPTPGVAAAPVNPLPAAPVALGTPGPELLNPTGAAIANRQAATLGVNAGEFRNNFTPLETIYARGDGSDQLVNPEVGGIPELTAASRVEREPPNPLLTPAVEGAMTRIGLERAAPGFELPGITVPAVNPRQAVAVYRSVAAA